jgi:CheY-like chemotaxis protein
MAGRFATRMESGVGLKGVRVLLVEDESLLAMTVEGMLEDLGCYVAASASNVEDATARAQEAGFDCALLDVNLCGKPVFPVAEILSTRQIPFVFASGYGQSALPERFRSRPVVAKPFQLTDLSDALRAALEHHTDLWRE